MTDATTGTREFQGLQIPLAGTYVLDAAHNRIGFVARHLMVSKVRGNFGVATATITVGEDPLQSSVTATIQTESVFTGQRSSPQLRPRPLAVAVGAPWPPAP